MVSEESKTILEDFVRALSGIPDRDQRGYALAERLVDLANETIVDLVKEIVDKAVAGDEGCVKLYRGILSNQLEETLGSERLSRLVTHAQDKGYFETVSIYMDLPVETSPETPMQPFLDGDLKDTPLGMRKALARKPDMALIERIARDQDHRVISVLLTNPRLTEHDVIRIASTRPTSPRVLEEIFRSGRWVARYGIKKTIVLNPHTPVSLALKLLPFMQAQDLRQIMQAHDLDPLLRESAAKMNEKKVAARGEEERD